MTDAPSRAEQLLRAASELPGGVARGVLEVVRALESTKCPVRAVFVAKDIDFNFDRRLRRTDLIARLCRNRRVPMLTSYAKDDLGRWSGLDRPAAAVAILRLDSVPLLAAEAAEHASSDYKTLPVLQSLVDREQVGPAAVRQLSAALDAAAAPATQPGDRAGALLDILLGCLHLANEHGISLEAEFDRWALSAALQPKGPRGTDT
jgi:ribosomal protein L7Ae-like RNA K-turn-binding protein